MATTCSFGQLKDLRITAMCIGDTQVIDKDGNMRANDITASGNVVVCGDLTVKGGMNMEATYERCVIENSTKTQLDLFMDEQGMLATEGTSIVTWDETEYNLGNLWESNERSRITIKKPGVYHIEASIDWEGSENSNSSERNVYILKNGSQILSGDTKYNVPIRTIVAQNCSCDVALAEDDYIEMQISQDSGSGLGINLLGMTNLSVRYTHANSLPRGFSIHPADENRGRRNIRRGGSGRKEEKKRHQNKMYQRYIDQHRI